MISAVAKDMPGFPIMATGGCDSADAAMQFLQCGASVVQISSSIQNQDFTLISDYESGLRTLLYMASDRENFGDWEGQSAPRPDAKGAIIGRGLPKFGPYKEERRKLVHEEIKKKGVVLSGGITPSHVDTSKPPTSRKDLEHFPAATLDPCQAKPIDAHIGAALPRIGAWNDLDGAAQVVAVVDEELCINCGKCVMTCNDTAYQAIEFDPKTHIPHVTDKCTGCTLCASVCPIPNCITMVYRNAPYAPDRGIPVGQPPKIVGKGKL